MNLRQTVQRLPVPLQQGMRYTSAAIPLPLRYGRVFRETYALLKRSQWWSRQQLEEYQRQQLKYLLEHAYTHVPYYRRIFHERGLTPSDIRSSADLTKLPTLNKEVVRNNSSDLLADNIAPRLHFPVKTSGSTISPLSFFWQKNLTIPKEDGFLWIIWNIAGYRFNEKRVDITWKRLDNNVWQYDPRERLIKISAMTLTDEMLNTYVNLIRKFRPKVIKSIPSVLVMLAAHIKARDIPPFPLVKILLCASEMIYPWQRSLIEDAFDCRLFTFYGQSERVILACECEVNTKYHVFPEYGITEIIDSRGRTLKPGEGKGRIIGTGFNNYAMPFIRYEVGDIGAWSQDECSCGREYPLLEGIEGRESDYLVSLKGDLIPLISISYSSILKEVKQFQFHQDTQGHVTLKVVPLPSFTSDSCGNIRAGLLKELDDMEVDVELTDHLPRTGAGKYKYVIQKLPIEVLGLEDLP